MPEMTDEFVQGQLALLQRWYEEKRLTEEEYRAEIENLGCDPDVVFAQQNQRVQEQTNVGGDYHDHRQFVTQVASDTERCDPEVDDETALSCYLRHVIQSHSRLQLQGIRSASGLVSIPLEEIYVTLTATVRKTVRDEEAWLEAQAALAPGEAKRQGRGHPRESVAQVKVQVQEALDMHPRLVVLGDPGSGKTTLLRYLALTFARDLRDGGRQTTDEQRWGKERLGLDEERLPVLLPLRDFARYLEHHFPHDGADGPKRLLAYLHTYFENQQLTLPPDFFATRLAAGECGVLLDGVDEVASLPLRRRVSRIVERFTLAYPENRYVVTSRIVGYTGGARLGADYAVTTVRDFTADDIARFARHWNRAVEVVLAGEEKTYVLRKAEVAAKQLIAAIESNPRVRELAVNPLLLTVIALVQRYRAQLPERRVELYEEAIEVLLVQWDAVKGLSATAVLQGLELDAGDRRSLLEPVALWMMEQRLREIELDDLRRQLAQPFKAMLKDWRQTVKAVNGFVHLINARSGLLTERGQGIYAFSHLTFQEHLAARAVADREDYIDYTLKRVGDSWWREVVLLEVGYLSTQGKRRATELIRAIMEHQEEPEPYHNLVLAAEAVRDVGQARTRGDLSSEIQGRLRQAFETPLHKGNDLPALIKRRAAAAEALGKIESGQFGAQPAFWTLPHGIPVWVEISAGEFWMGSQNITDDEKPVHQVHLERYWISRVPITNAQYRFFVQDAGYHAPGHWDDGKIPRGKESHPVVRVTWHDALAYCEWVQEKLQVAGYKLKVWQSEGQLATCNGQPATHRVQLPSETEWEKAARGADGQREYPWGEQWREGYCNTDELGVNETTPVGIFPEGVSPYGVLEMAGNVFEWTRNCWGYAYPYVADDGRENLEAGDDVGRVVRGGSFYGNRKYARCAYRYRDDPFSNCNDGGFRVVVSPSRP
jgi:formylglycine-generating enzyme required for sulfatase activity